MIEVRDLTKRFGETLAVDRLSFDVRPGVITGFLGPNGAGKSTTLRMIVGLDTPTAGAATIDGRPYAALARPIHEVGALLDAKAVHPKRSARQHLRWLAQAGGIPTGRVDEVLHEVGLTGVAERRAGRFSLGMSQRLGIAAALLGDPRILLLDEAVNGLDPEGIFWVRNLLRRLASEGRTILLSSHLMSEMEETADHILVIGRGRLIADMSTTELTERSAGNRVRVVSPRAGELARRLEAIGATAVADGGSTLTVTGVDAPRIGEFAAGHGIPLHELTPERASLESAFMELTRDSVDYRSSTPAATPMPDAEPASTAATTGGLR